MADPAEQYSAAGQARSVAGLLDELELGAAVVAGYDIGSRIAQALARAEPDRVRALVLAPPLPGIGQRILTPDAMREFWYQPFHRLDLAERLIDGNAEAVRAYLRHFWEHWSGPGLTARRRRPRRARRALRAAGRLRRLDQLVPRRLRRRRREPRRAAPRTPPTASQQPTRVLWPEHDPLFPREWGDRIDDFFADAALTDMPGAGHFSPLEAPQAFADAIRELTA